jgi:hypothetical protein
MAEHNGDFGLTRLERMERRLQSLEDTEAIRNLNGALRDLVRRQP